MKVSLILATVDRVTELERLLTSLVAQSRRDFELLIIDQNADGRLQPLLAHARELGIDVKHLRQSERNLSRARNEGLKLATNDVVAFPDDDCWYDKNVISEVLQVFENDSDLDGLVARWVEYRGHQTDTRELSVRGVLRFREIVPSSIEIFFRRELLCRLGGFDENFGLSRWFGAAEETDLVMRAASVRARLRYVPAVAVHHPYAGNATPNFSQAWAKERVRARGTGAIYAKHRLASWVLLRGFLSPIVKAMLPPYGMNHLGKHVSTFVGRIEGFWCWRKAHVVRANARM